jgi:hypothetical protein
MYNEDEGHITRQNTKVMQQIEQQGVTTRKHGNKTT